MPTLKDILSNREMFSVEEHESVTEVSRRMAVLRVGAILVLRDGKLRGIFSERDLLTRIVVENRDAAHTRVAEVMTTNLATIQEEASIDDAMDMMRRVGCRHLPVLRGERVTGMVSMRDLMNFELERKTEEIRQMRAYIGGAS